MSDDLVRVSVVWATPAAQDVIEVALPIGASIATAIAQSGLVERYSIDLAALRVGIHGRLAEPDAAIADGDRIEIYRPLVAEPKEARRARALASPLPAKPPVVKRGRSKV